MSANSLFSTHYATKESLQNLSAKLDEPAWLAERRLVAFEAFESLPMDKDSLFYKYTTFRSFDPSTLKPSWEMNQSQSVDRTEKGEFDIIETESSFEVINPRSAENGFIIELHQLIKDDEQLAKKIISEVDEVSDNFDKLGSLAKAFCRNTTIIYVPKNVKVDKSFAKLTRKSDDAVAMFTELIIYLEEGAEASVLEIFDDPQYIDARQFYNSIQTIILGEMSDLKLMQIQNWSNKSLHVLSKIAKLDRYAKYLGISHLQGSEMSRVNSNVLLNGQGSEGYDLFIQFGHNKQRFDVKSELQHNSTDTIGQTHARTVMMDKSESILRGLIVIPEVGVNADSWLTSKGMTIGKGKISAVPSLEILQNDVKAAHAASVEPLNEDLLFYLESRGIERSTARELLIKGYFEQILKLMIKKELIDISRDYISQKWDEVG